MIELVEKDGRLVAVETEPRKEWIYGDYVKFNDDKPGEEEQLILNASLVSFLRKMDDCGAELLALHFICKYKDIKTYGWKAVVSKEVKAFTEGKQNA